MKKYFKITWLNGHVEYHNEIRKNMIEFESGPVLKKIEEIEDEVLNFKIQKNGVETCMRNDISIKNITIVDIENIYNREKNTSTVGVYYIK